MYKEKKNWAKVLFLINSGMRQEIFGKEELQDNLVRERIDRAGGWEGEGGWPRSHGRDYLDFWYVFF